MFTRRRTNCSWRMDTETDAWSSSTQTQAPTNAIGEPTATLLKMRPQLPPRPLELALHPLQDAEAAVEAAGKPLQLRPPHVVQTRNRLPSSTWSMTFASLTMTSSTLPIETTIA